MVDLRDMPEIKQFPGEKGCTVPPEDPRVFGSQELSRKNNKKSIIKMLTYS
jgi:hypothetical protein